MILQEAHRNFWEGNEASKVSHSQDGEGPRLPWGSGRPIVFSESHSMSQTDQGQCKVGSTDDPGWVFPSPRACPTFSPLLLSCKHRSPNILWPQLLWMDFPIFFFTIRRFHTEFMPRRSSKVHSWVDGEILILPARHWLSTNPCHVYSAPKLVRWSPVDGGTEVQQGSDLPRSSAEPRICTQSPKTGSQSPWLPLRAWGTEGVEKNHCTANTPILQVRRLTLRAGGMCSWCVGEGSTTVPQGTAGVWGRNRHGQRVTESWTSPSWHRNPQWSRILRWPPSLDVNN